MQVTSSSITHNSPIPGNCAFCVPASEGHVAMGQNQSPHLAWSGAPAGTRSYAVLCVDVDVPSKPDDVNQEGRSIPADLPRVDFYHWVLVDIPAATTQLAAGADSDGVTAKGKPAGQTPNGRRGINDYTVWFKGDADMGGNYGGYDGPCPPWNDTIVHHYTFRVVALDVEKLDVAGDLFTAGDALKAMAGHILDQGEITGTYSLNPAVKA